MNENLQQDIYEEIKGKLMDNEFINKYGTSVYVNMGREYRKHLENNFERLKKEFDKINKNNDDVITKDEIILFFKKQNSSVKFDNFQFDEGYLNKLFDLIDLNRDSEVTIKEFVLSYMILEEKIRLKKFKIQKLIDDLNESLENYMKQAKLYKKEKMNRNGCSENAELKITLIEAIDLEPMDINGKSDPYALLILDDEKVASTMKPETLNPLWNENFTMKPISKDQILRVDIYDRDEHARDDFQGMVSIPLKDLQSQLKYDIWYDLKDTDNLSPRKGKIHLRLQFIWSKFTCFQELVNSTENRLTKLKEEMMEVDKYFELFKTPFGLILSGEITKIIDKKIIEDNDLVIHSQQRNSVFSNRNSPTNMYYQSYRNTLNLSTDAALIGRKTIYFNWSSIVILFMGLLLFTNLVSLLARTDFLNLIASMLIWIIYFSYTKKMLNTLDYLKYYWKLLISLALYDFLWFYFHIEGYLFRKSDYDSETSSLQKVSLIFSAFNFLVKLVLSTIIYINLN